VNDLPVPYNLQAVVLNRAITLEWAWTPPESRPNFTEFGFEIRREDGKTATTPGTTYSEENLPFGTYTYRVRVRGAATSKGKLVTHVSDWSEPVTQTIKVACTGAPQVQLAVEPIRRDYGSVPSLRFRLRGQATVPEGCTLGRVSYRVDTGTGIEHQGPLKTNRAGQFDTVIEALGPDDQMPEGGATFQVTATAENEAGPTTSDAFSISLELQDRFAPRGDY
jgi:hypothetical protein